MFIDMRRVETPPVAVIAAVSEQQGVDLVMQFEFSVNQKKFTEFLIRLRNKYPFRRMALFCDHLSAHKTKKVKAKYRELRYEVVFNVPYSPETNSVEHCFSIVKRRYRKDKLEAYVNGVDVTTEDLIDTAFTAVSK